MSLEQRLGVLGGTFDPIHNGHLQLARLARAALALDRVLLIPAGDPPLKLRSSASAEDRLRMVELACEEERGLECCDIEVRRSGPSYTVATLRALHAAHPGARLWFLMGRDALADLDRWHEARALFELASFGVISRAGEPPLQCLERALPARLWDGFARGETREGPGGKPRRTWRHSSGQELVALEVEPDAISSTELRAALARDETAAKWLPPAVTRYIAERGLYREPEQSKAEPASAAPTQNRDDATRAEGPETLTKRRSRAKDVPADAPHGSMERGSAGFERSAASTKQAHDAAPGAAHERERKARH